MNFLRQTAPKDLIEAQQTLIRVNQKIDEMKATLDGEEGWFITVERKVGTQKYACRAVNLQEG